MYIKSPGLHNFGQSSRLVGVRLCALSVCLFGPCFGTLLYCGPVHLCRSIFQSQWFSWGWTRMRSTQYATEITRRKAYILQRCPLLLNTNVCRSECKLSAICWRVLEVGACKHLIDRQVYAIHANLNCLVCTSVYAIILSCKICVCCSKKRYEWERKTHRSIRRRGNVSRSRCIISPRKRIARDRTLSYNGARLLARRRNRVISDTWNGFVDEIRRARCNF